MEKSDPPPNRELGHWQAVIIAVFVASLGIMLITLVLNSFVFNT
jgi:hypothetical protein